MNRVVPQTPKFENICIIYAAETCCIYISVREKDFFVPNVVISGVKCNGRVLHGESIGFVKDIDVR